MGTQTHYLKVKWEYWEAVASGDKNFEVRRDDRGFQKGDIVMLRCMTSYAPDLYDTLKPTLAFEITYILTGGQFGIEPGYVVMGLRQLIPTNDAIEQAVRS
jgi:hypothetical protein